MSSVYVLEPPTRGKVIVNTTCGPLDIELWSREVPKACRNFVQLCLEKYYDRTIFHRIIPDFMVQGGDHTGTGKGGESIYGEPFEDEFHTRLRFRQRGFVGCANANEKNSNNSQFFITLNRCDWLSGKHTLFGKITGDTIYNLLKLAESETGKDDRPLEPPSILSTEVLWNPFDDIVPRKLKGPETKQAEEPRQPIKQKKKLNLLSFGEEALEEEQEIGSTNKTMKSSHDVLDDPRLLKADDAVKESREKADDDATRGEEEKKKRRKELQTNVRQALSGKPALEETTEEVLVDENEDLSFDEKMRREILEKRKVLDKSAKGPSSSKARPVKRSVQEEEASADDKDKSESENDRIVKEKLVIKKKGLGSEAKAQLALEQDADMQLLTPLQQQRQKFKQRKRDLRGREEETLEMLNKFKERLEKDTELFNHKLEFVEDKKDKMKRSDDVDHYVVFDPLIEKGKEKFNKMQAKMKRRNREWAGRSLT